MANLLNSSQTTTTTAPGYYNDYLATLATQGGQAAQAAKFAGVTDLQNQAFQNVTPASTAYQPTLNEAGSTLTSAANATSPLAAGAQYLNSAQTDPSQRAAQYMSPYINTVVNQLGDLNNRNIQQNLAPLAMAGGIGSGQFGSQRANQVLGQTINNANQNTLAQQFQALNTGYNTALNTAEQQNALEGQLGATAGNQAYQGQTGLTNVGQQLGALAQTNQNLGLNTINAQDTLGTQQQTIAQNEQNYPLAKLQAMAGLMSGQSIPTTSATSLNASPLSGIVTGAALGAGLLNSGLGATLGKGASSLYDTVTGKNTTATDAANTPTSKELAQATLSGGASASDQALEEAAANTNKLTPAPLSPQTTQTDQTTQDDQNKNSLTPENTNDGGGPV